MLVNTESRRQNPTEKYRTSCNKLKTDTLCTQNILARTEISEREQSSVC